MTPVASIPQKVTRTTPVRYRRHPRLVRTGEAELEALYAMLVSLGATKMMAERLMQDYPLQATACQVIVDFASDREGDIRGTIAQLDGEPL